MRTYSILVVLWIVGWQWCSAQTVRVENISIDGNKQTRRGVILRELPLAIGDSLAESDLPTILTEARQQLINTGLFTQVNITYLRHEAEVPNLDVIISLRENWYVYPVPVFELADRSFNVWWTEQNRSLDRINYGLEFTHQNFSGWRDKLQVGFQSGYTQQYNFEYNMPYLNQSRTLGLLVSANYSRNREVNYRTEDNKQLFYGTPDGFLFRRLKLELGLSYRRRLYNQHDLWMGFNRQLVDTAITHRNAYFFNAGNELQRFFYLSYRYRIDRRDVRPYPWRGWFFTIKVDKDGLGQWSDINALTLESHYRRYLPIGQRWSIGTAVAGKTALLRQRQPYMASRALGFGENSLRGYEFYIVDGLDMLHAKLDLRYRLLSSLTDFGRLMPIKAFKRMPWKVYLAVHANSGWANDPFTALGNPLANQWLRGIGGSVDLVLFFDKTISLQYNRNHRGEGGIFIKLDMNI